jgi:hypothetical protein
MGLFLNKEKNCWSQMIFSKIFLTALSSQVIFSLFSILQESRRIENGHKNLVHFLFLEKTFGKLKTWNFLIKK